jgi:hypothetical protein
MTDSNSALVRYDAVCRALAEANRVDEVKDIRDAAIAMAAYAKQAKNREAEADAVAIRMRATRRLDQLRQAQKDSIGLAKGGKPYQRKLTGASDAPLATLAMQGIDKHLAKQARALGALSDDAFEAVVVVARDKVKHVLRDAVREVEVRQRRASHSVDMPRMVLPLPGAGRKTRVLRNASERRWISPMPANSTPVRLQRRRQGASRRRRTR